MSSARGLAAAPPACRLAARPRNIRPNIGGDAGSLRAKSMGKGECERVSARQLIASW